MSWIGAFGRSRILEKTEVPGGHKIMTNPCRCPAVRLLGVVVLALALLFTAGYSCGVEPPGQEDPRSGKNKQPAQSATGNRVSVTLKLKITAEPQTKLLVLDVQLPRSIPGRQKIIDIAYSTKPASVFEKNGQSYAQFLIDQFPKDLVIAIDVNAEVYRYDYSIASHSEKGRQFEHKGSLAQWLIHEQYLDKYSPLVQAAAKGLSGKDEEETLRKCFDFVRKTLTFGPYDPNDPDHGAEWALQQRKGVCTEFADLFVALCRAEGIPARFCEGYLVGSPLVTPKHAHAWAEVYTQKYGWVPIDPSAYLGDVTKFAKMDPVYLLLNVERRNGVLPYGHIWAYCYTGGPVKDEDEFRVNKLQKLQSK